MARVTGSFGGHALDADGVRFALESGIAPSRGTAVIAADRLDAPEIGDLVLTHGTDTVRLRNVRAESAQVVHDGRGKRLELALVDRRWRWAYGHITGTYNSPLANGVPSADQSLRALAARCLTALGETVFDVSALSANVFPFVQWEFASPAAALEALLGGRYCVALGSDDIVRICKRGAGAALPPGAQSLRAAGRAVTPKADGYRVRGGRTIREVTVEDLEPVGEETNGSVVAIASLSYAPDPMASDGGWGEAALHGFANIADEADRARAQKSIFKWYALPLGSGLPILDARVSTITVNGQLSRRLPQVSGIEHVWDGQTWRADSVTRVKGGYALDRTLGLVKFRRMVTQAEGNAAQGATKLIAASIDLTYAYELNGGTESDFYIYDFGNTTSPLTVVLHRTELVLRQVDTGSGPVDQNRTALDVVALAVIGAYRENETFVGAQSAQYNTIVNLFPDGAIERVAWSLDATSGAMTHVTRNPARPPVELAIVSAPLPVARDTADPAQDEQGIGGEYRLCKNVSGFDIPANSLVVASGWDATGSVITVDRSGSDEGGTVLLAPHKIKSGQIGKCYDTGTHGVIFDATNPGNPASDPVAVGERLAPQTDSFRAIKSSTGTLVVRAVVRAATVPDPTGLALVGFVGAGAETRGIRIVIVTDITSGSTGAYKVKQWGSTSGATGAEFDVKGHASQYALNDVTFAVLDADGVWQLAMAPYALWG